MADPDASRAVRVLWRVSPVQSGGTGPGLCGPLRPLVGAEPFLRPFGYDEEREVFFDHEGNVVLTRHYADRRVFEERGPESAAEEPGRAQSPGPVPEALVRPQSARDGARCSVALGDESG